MRGAIFGRKPAALNKLGSNVRLFHRSRRPFRQEPKHRLPLAGWSVGPFVGPSLRIWLRFAIRLRPHTAVATVGPDELLDRFEKRDSGVSVFDFAPKLAWAQVLSSFDQIAWALHNEPRLAHPITGKVEGMG